MVIWLVLNVLGVLVCCRVISILLCMCCCRSVSKFGVEVLTAACGSLSHGRRDSLGICPPLFG